MGQPAASAAEGEGEWEIFGRFVLGAALTRNRAAGARCCGPSLSIGLFYPIGCAFPQGEGGQTTDLHRAARLDAKLAAPA